jgi:SAM-dependent methyltransferase
MTDRWRTYIFSGIQNEGGAIPFALTQWDYLSPVFAEVRRRLPHGGRLLDVGCGAGLFASLIAHHGYDVTGIDEDPAIVERAVHMADYLRSPARFQCASAFDLSRFYGRFDLAYSLGVVEHFEPDTTVGLIAEQGRCAPFVLVVVPTRFTKYAAAVTDERLYRRRQVEELVQKAGLRVRRSFVFGTVPTSVGISVDRFLPRIVVRAVACTFTYGMNICCLGQSSKRVLERPK